MKFLSFIIMWITCIKFFLSFERLTFVKTLKKDFNVKIFYCKKNTYFNGKKIDGYNIRACIDQSGQSYMNWILSEHISWSTFINSVNQIQTSLINLFFSEPIVHVKRSREKLFFVFSHILFNTKKTNCGAT